jgi:SAM-dependent methyltransferase
VEWREGNAMDLPFATHTFDLVVCQQGLQFFPDSGTALREAHRVLVPGGRFAVAVWCAIESSPGHHALTRGLERHVGTEAAGLAGPNRSSHGSATWGDGAGRPWPACGPPRGLLSGLARIADASGETRRGRDPRLTLRLPPRVLGEAHA